MPSPNRSVRVFAEPVGAGEGFVEPVFAQIAALDGRRDALDHRRRVAGVEEQVYPGAELRHGEVGLGPAGGLDPTHVEAVRDHDAAEPHLVAQHALEDRSRERRRHTARVEGGVGDVRRHHELAARAKRRAERDEVGAVEHGARIGDRREDGVGVLGRVAVTGEVLGRREQPFGATPSDVGRRERRRRLGRWAERSDRNHRVRRVPVHVGDGRERDVGATRKGLTRRRPGKRFSHRLGVVERGEGAGVGEDGRPSDLLSQPALHVGHHEERTRRLALPGSLLQVDERRARLGPRPIEEDQTAERVAVEESLDGGGILFGAARRLHVRPEPDDDEAGGFATEAVDSGHGLGGVEGIEKVLSVSVPPRIFSARCYEEAVTCASFYSPPSGRPSTLAMHTLRPLPSLSSRLVAWLLFALIWGLGTGLLVAGSLVAGALAP